MKPFGLLILMLFATCPAQAELDTLWSRDVTFGLSSFSLDAAVILQNREVMAASPRGNSSEVELWRYGYLGDLLWNGAVSYDGQYCSVLGMDQYADGQIVLVLMVWNNGDSTNLLTIMRLNDVGVVLGEDSFDIQLVSFNNKAGVCATHDNNLLVFASQYDFAGGHYVDLLMKFNSAGDTLWTRRVSEHVDTWGACVAEFANGDLALAGSMIADNFAYNGFVARTSPTGSIIWDSQYQGGEQEQLNINAIALDAAGNMYVGGSAGFWFGFAQPWAICLEPDGDEIWSLTGLEGTLLSVSGIRPTGDGGAFICGSASSEVGPYRGLAYSVNSVGEGGTVPELEVVGEDLRGLYSRDRGAVIYGTNMNSNEFVGRIYRIGPGYIATGFVRAQGTNEPLPNVKVEMVETGDFVFTDAQGIYLLGAGQGNGTLRASSPCTTPAVQTVDLPEGEETVVNFTVGIPQYENNTSSVNIIATFGRWERDTLIVYNDGNGALQFSCEVIENLPTYGWLYVSPASGEIAAGSSAEIVVSVHTDPSHPESEFFGEVVVHHNACPDTVDEVGVYILALDSPDRPAPVETFILHPAYPNPFNSSARVSFELPHAAHVTAKLYSIEGREINTLVDDVLTSGAHELPMDGAKLATGVYLLRVTAGSFVETQKLVLLK